MSTLSFMGRVASDRQTVTQRGAAILAAALVVASTCVLAAGPKAGTAVLDRAIASIGGEVLLDRIGTLVVSTATRRHTPAGWLTTATRSFVRFPADFRQEIELGGKTIAMVSSPQGAFLASPESELPVSEAQRHNIEMTALRNPLVLLKVRRSNMFAADVVDQADAPDAECRVFYNRQIAPAPATATFSDVPVGAQFFAEVEALRASGITQGCTASTFCPDATLTRRQMAAFLARALGLHWPPF